MSLSSQKNQGIIIGVISLGSTLCLIRWLINKRTKQLENDVHCAGTLMDMPLLPISSEETIRKCRNLQLRDSDIFICSYPKSGTTWMQQIVVSLLSRGKHPAKGEHISSFSPFYEIDPHWEASTGLPKTASGEAVLGRRVFNTHLRWSQMPRSNSSKAKYIYVIRDGRDVVTSFYHHLSNQANAGGYEGTFDEFFDLWLKGELPYGKYVDHIKSWLLRAGSGKDNVLVVYYDKLKSDLNFQLVRINGFLGLEPLMVDASKNDDSVWMKMLEVVSFSFMKENIDRFQPNSVEWKGGYQFIRKGVIGDHKALLSEDQLQRFQDSLMAEFPVSILEYPLHYIA